jgi:hypothetical protein
MRALLVISVLALAPAVAAAQEAAAGRGTVTYVSGDVYYISLGSAAGVADSTIVPVVDRADTVAMLLVFAVSSKSSACRLVTSTRAPKVGDAVLVRVEGETGTATPPGTAVVPAFSDTTVPSDSTAPPDSTARAALPESNLTRSRRDPRARPALEVHGRVSAGYQTYIPDPAAATVTEPSLSVSIRGQASGVPLRFEIAGNIRSSVTGTSGPFAAGGVNRNRIYRLSVEYDDSLNRFGVGRLFPSRELPSGYIDGVVAARKIGAFSVGAAAGFEPDFTQKTFLSDRKKVMVFAGASTPFLSMGAGYARTFTGSSTERSVVSGSATVTASSRIYFYGQSDVDFLSVKNEAILRRPKLSSLLAQMNYRISDLLSVGTGVTAWRPVYPISPALMLPDSLKDDRLWVSPSLSLRVYAAGGFNLQEQYAPRTTENGFGEEYSNMLSVGYDNLVASGVGVRFSQTLSKSSIDVSTGYGVTLRRSIGGVADAGLRYQYYRHDFTRQSDGNGSTAVGADLSFAVTNAVYLMLNGEWSSGTLSEYRLFSGNVSWRF